MRVEARERLFNINFHFVFYSVKAKLLQMQFEHEKPIKKPSVKYSNDFFISDFLIASKSTVSTIEVEKTKGKRVELKERSALHQNLIKFLQNY